MRRVRQAILTAGVLSLLPLAAGDRALLMDPLKVKGERAGTRVGEPGGEIPTSYLPATFRVVVRASDAAEAWAWLGPRFDDAVLSRGLEPVGAEDASVLRALPGSHRLKDDRLYRCKNHGAMERLRGQLTFVNQRQETRGWIRQILVGVGPVPASEFRGATSQGWQDEIGLRVYIIGRPEGSGAGGDLPFDVTPLVRDLATTLEAAAR